MHPVRVAACVFLLFAFCISACEDGDSSTDSSAAAGQGGEASTAGQAGEANKLVPCLDRPDELSRPPAGQLPCDLLPPDFPN